MKQFIPPCQVESELQVHRLRGEKEYEVVAGMFESDVTVWATNEVDAFRKAKELFERKCYCVGQALKIEDVIVRKL